MAQKKYIKLSACLIMMGGLLASSLSASAATVTLNFEAFSTGGNNHGPTVTESGYTLTSTTIFSVKPGASNSNGTTSLYTPGGISMTITAGPDNDTPFDVLSMDFGELFSSGTPIVGFTGVTAEGGVVIDQLVISGQSSFWNYHVEFGSLFTNLVSFTLSSTTPYQYQFDNIELSSVMASDGSISATPLPATLPMFGMGALAFYLLGRRRRQS